MQEFFTPMPFEDMFHEYTELSKKMVKGVELLSQIREEDIQIGITPKQAVYKEDKLVLYRFQPQVEIPLGPPVLIVYALVNRPYMVDLQAERSLVARLLELGLDIYLIDWGYPSRADRWLTLSDYINGYLDNCVDFVRRSRGVDRLNILGICQGGVFSLCYSSLYQEKVKNLIVMVTPVNFCLPRALLNMRGGATLGSKAIDIDLMVQAQGNIPGDYLNYEFLMLKPRQMGYQKYFDFPDIMEDEKKLLNFLRMEKWIFDSPDLAGEAYRQYMKDFYQDNKLIAGQVRIDNQRVDLGKLQMPILNLYAEKDHLVAPESSLALEHYVGSKDYTVQSFPVGHIGMYVSGKVQRTLPTTIANWLEERVD